MSKKKRIGLYVLLVAAVIAIGVLLYRDPWTQSKLANSGNVQDGFAQAICAGDVSYLHAHGGGSYELPLEMWQAMVAATTWECHGVRYLGSVNGPDGPEYFYVMDIGEFELWYGLTVADGKVVDIE